jgi:CRP-like cAMP-binding protein
MIRNVTVQSGERTNAAGKPVRNKILLSIPHQEFRAIRPYLEYCSFPSHLTLHEKRLARWLLMAQDRVDSALIAMTHDFLATMLGTTRPTVSSAAAILQENGAIKYIRGAVSIVNRRKLKYSACECYGVIQRFNSELGLR